MTRERLGRRRLLRSGGVGLAALLAGCPGGTGTDERTATDFGPTVRPSVETEARPPSRLPPVLMLTGYGSRKGRDRWTALAAAFEDATDIGVDLRFLPSFEYYLPEMVDEGEPPDVHTNRLESVLDYWSAGRLAPVTDVLDRARDVSGPLVAEPYTDGEDYWTLPYGYSADTFAYRRDVYERLGLDVPTSFEGVVETARAVDESDLDVRGYGLAGKRVGKSRDEFQAYLARMGVSPVGLRWRDPDVRARLEVWWPEREITRLLEFLDDLSQYSPDPTTLGWSASIQGWLTGRFAQGQFVNNWLAGLAARGVGGEERPSLVEHTGVAPLPYWETGGVTEDDSWASGPTLDGYHVYAGGGNTPGAREWLSWLYGERGRAASLYRAEPTRLLPAYDGLHRARPYRTAPLFEEYPRLLDQVDFVRETVVAEHYGTVPEADLSDPVAMFVGKQWFFGELINRVVTGESSVREAYEWGRETLRRHLDEARRRFR